MTESVDLPFALRQQLIDHARSQPLQEVCGLLGGSDRTLTSIYPVENVDSQPERRFLMEPEGQIEAIRAMREREEELSGIYHSHPATAAVPSPTDLELAAYPGVYYFIISLKDNEPELRCYRLKERGYREINIKAGAGSSASS